MKCPRCGSEMTLDSHRKIPLMMCYECGYIEGRNVGETAAGKSNYARLQTLNLNETAAFIASGLGLEPEAVADWLDDTSE